VRRSAGIGDYHPRVVFSLGRQMSMHAPKLKTITEYYRFAVHGKSFEIAAVSMGLFRLAFERGQVVWLFV
jgi:hypothetical protein